MMRRCNLVEFFSGIGSQAKALKNLNIEVNTLGTSEWDVHALAAYDLIHNSEPIPDSILAMDKPQLLQVLKKHTFSNTGKAPLDYNSLKTYSREALQRLYTSVIRNHNFVDISALAGDMMPDNIDILTYSFPCQDLSNVGAFHGYTKGIDKDSGSRSSLLWQVGRILTEMRTADKALPRFLLMENVPALLSKRHFGNFSTWIHDLEDLGYISKYYQLNAVDFGLPQNRPRLLMISVYVGSDARAHSLISSYFTNTDEDTIKSDYRSSAFFKEYRVSDLLRTNYNNPKIFAEAVECTPNDTVSRQKIWEDNPKIVLPGYALNESITCVRTITTKQDRNPNSGNLYFDSNIDGKSKFRYLTPRECLLFMGFEDADYRQLKYNNTEYHKGDALFARDKIIRMAGNSIPVKLLEGVFLQVLKIDELLSEYYESVRAQTQIFERYEMYSKEIRSYMFARGIRSRLKDEEYPQNACVLYPKYKAAVFIRPCTFHGKMCSNAGSDNEQLSIWQYTDINAHLNSDPDIQMAQKMGWSSIVVWECEMVPDHRKDTMEWIAKKIQESLSTEPGSVFRRG